MRLIERYIFRRMASALVLSFLSLGMMVWLARALREFNLVTANGQSISAFLHVSLFLVPVLVTIVLPVATLIAVIYTLTTLNGDSELVVINASGAPQFATVKPALLIGVITAVLVGSMTLYYAPLSTRLGQMLVTSIRGNILTSILREGQFMSLDNGLTFHMRGRNPDGSLQGILIADDREADKSLTYLAEKGAILDNPLGVFLIMTDGVIQQRNATDGSISMIEFSSYAFDLSTFTSRGTVAALRPSERSTAYLLDPDPDDPYFRQSPGEFRAELHSRLTTPLYGLAFALLPLLFIGQAESPRQSRAASIAMVIGVVTVISAIGLFLPNFAGHSMAVVILMYALPLGAAAITVTLVLAGVQLRPSERVVAFGEALFGRVSGLLRPGAEATAGDTG